MRNQMVMYVLVGSLIDRFIICITIQRSVVKSLLNVIYRKIAMGKNFMSPIFILSNSMY